jgi:hypothetical protein
MAIDKGQGLVNKYSQLNGMLGTIHIGHLEFIPTVFAHGYRTSFGRGFYM